MHKWQCRTFIAGVNLFINCRSAQFISKEELMFLLTNFTPCHECTPKSSDLSQMTGRLYKPIWDEHLKRIEGEQLATVQDIFTGEEGPVDE